MDFPNYKNYAGLIFDLDGTLINSMPFHVVAWEKVCAEHGFKIDPQLIYDMGGVSSRDVVTYFKNQGHEVGDIDAFVERKVELYREKIHEVKLFPKVLAILKEAHERGIKIAVGSGTQLKNAEDILRIHGLLDTVDAIVTAEMVQRHKPYPDTFLLCAKKMELQVSQCVVFEDGPLGVKAALAGGFNCIEVKDGEFVKLHEA
jgi:beta-phosphoglucomutase family hydrolase